jgi:hypothetical protein
LFNIRAAQFRPKKEAKMEQVNLGSVIEQAITRSSQNRLGEKPLVFVALAPVLPQIPWRDAALRRFLQSFCTSHY